MVGAAAGTSGGADGVFMLGMSIGLNGVFVTGGGIEGGGVAGDGTMGAGDGGTGTATGAGPLAFGGMNVVS